MGNTFPRYTVKLRENSPGHFEVTVAPWIVDHLHGKNGTILRPSIWSKDQWVKMEADAVVFEVIQE